MKRVLPLELGYTGKAQALADGVVMELDGQPLDDVVR